MFSSGMTIQLVIDIVLVVLLLITYLIYKAIKKNHMRDPEYLKRESEKIAERQREERRLAKEDEYFQSYASEYEEGYDDEGYDE